MSHRGLSVLVVEDELLIALDLQITLEQDGWTVIGPAMSVADALSTLNMHRPNVAILDVNLRGESATPVAELLRKLNIPFVLGSAYSHPGTLDKTLGDVDNVGKPAPRARLIAALEKLTSRPSD